MSICMALHRTRVMTRRRTRLAPPWWGVWYCLAAAALAQTETAAFLTGTGRPSSPRPTPPRLPAHENQQCEGPDVASAFKDSLALYEALRGTTEEYIRQKVANALDINEQALRLYGPRNVFCSFNGGKDAVVIMHLLRAAVAHYSQTHGLDPPAKPRLIYFAQKDEFPEVVELVELTRRQYDVDLITYHDTSIVDGLRICVEKEAGGPLAFILGTRQGDPNCKNQETFTPSSTWMPPFMRVNPILDWDYGQIWHFLRKFNLPYCSLYDQGYTSLGKASDTAPNPALAQAGGGYYPAYQLADWSLERAGRLDKKAKPPTASRPANMSACDKAARARTVGLIIIGDEILKGKTPDTNSLYAAQKLRDSGLQVKRIAKIPDIQADIIEEVLYQTKRYDVVITSGGVGPTHDDVTIKAVANALGQQMCVNADMVNTLRDFYGVTELNEGQKKMSILPDSAMLRTPPGESRFWPILQCDNVFILPGVPQYFEKKVDALVNHFLGKQECWATRKIIFGIEEVTLVPVLDEAVASFPRVLFGSYPIHSTSSEQVVITMEAPGEALVEEAKLFLLKRVAPEVVIGFEENDSLLLVGAGGGAAEP